MCLICVEWQKGKMTNEEAMRALMEVIVVTDEYDDEMLHFLDLAEKIQEKEEENGIA